MAAFGFSSSLDSPQRSWLQFLGFSRFLFVLLGFSPLSHGLGFTVIGKTKTKQSAKNRNQQPISSACSAEEQQQQQRCLRLRDSYRRACHEHPLVEKGGTLDETVELVQALVGGIKDPAAKALRVVPIASKSLLPDELLEITDVYKTALVHALELEPEQREKLEKFLRNTGTSTGDSISDFSETATVFADQHLRARKVLLWKQCLSLRAAFVDAGCPEVLFDGLDGGHGHAYTFLKGRVGGVLTRGVLAKAKAIYVRRNRQLALARILGGVQARAATMVGGAVDNPSGDRDMVSSEESSSEQSSIEVVASEPLSEKGPRVDIVIALDELLSLAVKTAEADSDVFNADVAELQALQAELQRQITHIETKLAEIHPRLGVPAGFLGSKKKLRSLGRILDRLRARADDLLLKVFTSDGESEIAHLQKEAAKYENRLAALVEQHWGQPDFFTLFKEVFEERVQTW